MNTHNIEAVDGILDACHRDAWNLAGDRNKPMRKALMFALTGKLIPVGKCGVNAIQEELELRGIRCEKH